MSRVSGGVGTQMPCFPRQGCSDQPTNIRGWSCPPSPPLSGHPPVGGETRWPTSGQSLLGATAWQRGLWDWAPRSNQ